MLMRRTPNDLIRRIDALEEQLAEAEADLARIRPVVECAADVASKYLAWATTPEGMLDECTMESIDALAAAVEKAEKLKKEK